MMITRVGIITANKLIESVFELLEGGCDRKFTFDHPIALTVSDPIEAKSTGRIVGHQVYRRAILFRFEDKEWVLYLGKMENDFEHPNVIDTAFRLYSSTGKSDEFIQQELEELLNNSEFTNFKQSLIRSEEDRIILHDNFDISKQIQANTVLVNNIEYQIGLVEQVTDEIIRFLSES